MPVPIRPVREIEENTPSVLMDGGFGIMNLSPLQLQVLEGKERKSSIIKQNDTRDEELLYEMWKNQEDEDLIHQASEARGEIYFNISKNVPESDIIRMKTNGILVGSGRNVTLTSKGEKILKDQILKRPSEIFINRKKDKFDFDKTAKVKLQIIK